MQGRSIFKQWKSLIIINIDDGRWIVRNILALFGGKGQFTTLIARAWACRNRSKELTFPGGPVKRLSLDCTP